MNLTTLFDRLYRPLPWAAVTLLSAASVALVNPPGWLLWEGFAFDLAILLLTAAGWLVVIERLPELESSSVELPPLAD